MSSKKSAGGEKLGKYNLVRELGRGGMGIVYEGLDPLIGRKVALKTIRFDVLTRREEQDEAQQRFMREARSAGILSHPNIVTIYDVGEDHGLTYIAMEFIEGQSLEAMIAGRQQLPLEDIISLIAQIGDALDYAHRNGIVHRDIKPANILVDGEGRPRIVDFGIARIASSSLTQTNTVLGTPYYMSPEQIAGRKVDHRADLFSLGAILYELLTFEKPFPGDSMTTVIYRIMNEEPPRPRDIVRDLPPGLDSIVAKARAKDPARRFQSGREIADALRSYRSFEGTVHSAAVDPAAAAAALDAGSPAPAEAARPRRPLILVLGGMLCLLAIVIVVLLLAGKKEPGFAGGGGGVAPATAAGDRPAGADEGSGGKTGTKADRDGGTPPGTALPPATDGSSSKPPASTFAAKPGGSAALVADKLQILKAAYQRALYPRCIDEALAVLRIDPSNPEAKNFLDLAVLKQAPLDLTAMLSEYTGTLTKLPGQLNAFYAANAIEDLARRLRTEVGELLSDHEQFQVSASAPAVNVTDAGGNIYKAEMLFSEILTAISRSKRIRVLLYEGKIRWILERSDRWRIVKIDYITTN